MSETRTERASRAVDRRLPMKAHLEPALGLSVGAVVGILVGLLIPASQGWNVRLGAAWDVAMLSALVHPGLIIVTSSAERTRRRAAVDFPGRTTLGLIKLMVSVAGLVAAVWLLKSPAQGTSASRSALLLVLGVVAVATSWLLLHSSYTLRYAHMYYYEDGDAGGLHFEGGPPDDMDFAYFAFTIGMTFQTSDTPVNTRTMRRAVLGHALLSFVYNTTIVALAISLIAGRI